MGLTDAYLNVHTVIITNLRASSCMHGANISLHKSKATSKRLMIGFVNCMTGLVNVNLLMIVVLSVNRLAF